MELRIEQSEDMENKLENSSFELMEYDRRSNRYRIRLTKNDIEQNRELIKEILKKSYDNWNL
jgi:hypothetical protein